MSTVFQIILTWMIFGRVNYPRSYTIGCCIDHGFDIWKVHHNELILRELR